MAVVFLFFNGLEHIPRGSLSQGSCCAPEAPYCWPLPVPSVDDLALTHAHCCPLQLPFKASSKCLGCLWNLVTPGCCGVFEHRGLRCQRCQARRVTKPASCARVSVPTHKQGELRQLLGDRLVSVQLCMLYWDRP